MNKRNIKLAAVALTITATSIGTGAVISGSAIAGADVKAAEKATISMVAAGLSSGEAVHCTFDDVVLPDATGMVEVGVIAASDGTLSAPVDSEQAVSSIGEGPAGALKDGAIIDGQEIHAVPAELADGEFTVSVDGTGGDLRVFDGEAPVSAEGESDTATGTATADTTIGDAKPLPEGVKVIDAGSARIGTASECAEMRKTLQPEG